MFWKMDSPENIRPKALPRPPAEVSISMLGVIHTMEPFSVTMDSPGESWQMTTGVVSPWILYSISIPPFFSVWYGVPLSPV